MNAPASSSRIGWWLFGAAVLPLSPVLLYLPVRGNLISLVCVLVVLARYKPLRFRPAAYFAVLLTLLFTILPALYWSDIKLLFISVYALSAVVLVARLDRADLESFAVITSKILKVLLIGGLIGFVYAFVGGDALISFPNEDGRLNGLFLTTLSNSQVIRIIRPAGIFDEPGTFSFVISMTAALRHSLRMDKRQTWTLLSMGLITFSLAHVAYMLIHLAAELTTSSARARAFAYAVVILTAASAAVAFIPSVNAIANDALFQRFVISDGNLAGDNRSALLRSAMNQLDWRVFWWGLDSSCITDPTVCATRGYPQFGENPLAPLVLYGLFNAWLYYALELSLLAMFVWRRNPVAVGVFLVLLQRPNVMAFGYAVLIFMVARAIVERPPRIPAARATRGLPPAPATA